MPCVIHSVHKFLELELELELIQSHMIQNPLLRGEEGARRTRNRQSRH
jgi:hypothetical protein